MPYREESDSMGKVLVPEEVYYGAQTQRASLSTKLCQSLMTPSQIAEATVISDVTTIRLEK